MEHLFSNEACRHENGDMNFLTKDQELMYRVYEREKQRRSLKKRHVV